MKLKLDKWYIVNNKNRNLFTQEIYELYRETLEKQNLIPMAFEGFIHEYGSMLSRHEVYRFNSCTLTLNYRHEYYPQYMGNAINYENIINSEKINNKEVSRNMENKLEGAFELVEQYYNMTLNSLRVTREEAINDVFENSKIYKAYYKFKNELLKMKIDERDIPPRPDFMRDVYLTEEEREIIKAIEADYTDYAGELTVRCKACRSLLATSDTFEQKMIILKNYGIIDEEYQLNID